MVYHLFIGCAPPYSRKRNASQPESMADLQVAEMAADAADQLAEAIRVAAGEGPIPMDPAPPPPKVAAPPPPPKSKKKGPECPEWYKGADTIVNMAPLTAAKGAETNTLLKPKAAGPTGPKYIPVKREIPCANPFLSCHVGTPEASAAEMHTCPGCQRLICRFCTVHLDDTLLCWACTHPPAPASLLDVE